MTRPADVPGRFTVSFNIGTGAFARIGAFVVCPVHLRQVTIERFDDAIAVTGCCPAGVAAQLRQIETQRGARR